LKFCLRGVDKSFHHRGIVAVEIFRKVTASRGGVLIPECYFTLLCCFSFLFAYYKHGNVGAKHCMSTPKSMTGGTQYNTDHLYKPYM
jgi:hypothetical protein